MQPDVVIVGGGIVGVACAATLARTGQCVVLLERGTIGGGSTRAGGGMLSLQTKRAGAHLRLARRSMSLLREFGDRRAEEIGLRWSGGLTLARDEEEVAALGERAALLREAGVEAELLDAAAARETEPALSPAVRGALRCAEDGQVDPALFCRALAAAAREAGAEVREGTPVFGLTTEGERVTGVECSTGRLDTGAVVIAAGAWSAELARPLGIAWPIVPRRGLLLRSRLGPARVRHLLLDAEYCAAKTVPAAVAFSFSLQPAWDGRLLLGGSRLFVGFDTGTQPEEAAELRRRGEELLPFLEETSFAETSVGFRPWTPDGLPLVGPGPLDGLWVAAGHEGDGVTLALATAEILAAQMAGEAAGEDAAALEPGRLGG